MPIVPGGLIKGGIGRRQLPSSFGPLNEMCLATLDRGILDTMTATREAASRPHSPDGLPLIDIDWDAFDPWRIQ